MGTEDSAADMNSNSSSKQHDAALTGGRGESTPTAAVVVPHSSNATTTTTTTATPNSDAAAAALAGLGKLHRSKSAHLRRQLLDATLETQDQDNYALLWKNRQRMDR